jgi:cytochrome d ubiquinol oxidase subunit II
MADPITLLALTLLASLTLYALLGGADYGGGVWDLLASGPSAARQRRTIARAIGPVWEANHVWLIVVVVILFSGFPGAFAALSTFLHIPLLAVLMGIVMRGSAFVFRAYGSSDLRQEWMWGRVFAVASVATPFFLGVTIGAISEGHLPAQPSGTFADIYVRPWLTTFSLSVGVFALALFAFLAAVYLTLEAQNDDERAAFRRRALASGVVVGVLALIVFGLATPDLRRSLTASAWAPPLHIATGASALLAFGCLWTARFRIARIAAAAQVTLILWGWALAQYPYALRPFVTLADAAAPESVLVILLEVLAAGAILLVPALAWLFRVFGPRGPQASGQQDERNLSLQTHTKT